jgi:hypothetical protein
MNEPVQVAASAVEVVLAVCFLYREKCGDSEAALSAIPVFRVYRYSGIKH